MFVFIYLFIFIINLREKIKVNKILIERYF